MKKGCGKDEKIQFWDKTITSIPFQLRKQKFLSCLSSNFLVEKFYKAVSKRPSFFSTVICCILSFFSDKPGKTSYQIKILKSWVFNSKL